MLEGVAAAKVAQQRPSQSAGGYSQKEIDQYRERARELLLEVVEHDNGNLQAWLWLSTVMNDLADKAACLNNVLALDPGNKQAQAGLDWIKRRNPTLDVKSSEALKQTPSKPVSHTNVFLEPTVSTSIIDDSTAVYTRPRQNIRLQSKCPFCNQPISSMDTSCPHCKLPLVMECPACNTLMDVEWENCKECGFFMGNYQFGSMYFAHLALGYQKNTQFKKALQAILIAEGMDAEQPDLYRIKGEILHDIGQIKEAITTLEIAVEKEPDHVAPYISLGKALKQEGKWRQAKEIYEEAMRIAPDSSEPYYALGDLMWQQNRQRQARKYLEKALRLDPLHGLAWARMGQIHEANRKTSKAIDAYRKAVELIPRRTLDWEEVENRLNILDPPDKRQSKRGLGRSITETFKKLA
jgi:tetratricopeptide (TPR) repeat protein